MFYKRYYYHHNNDMFCCHQYVFGARLRAIANFYICTIKNYRDDLLNLWLSMWSFDLTYGMNDSKIQEVIFLNWQICLFLTDYRTTERNTSLNITWWHQAWNTTNKSTFNTYYSHCLSFFPGDLYSLFVDRSDSRHCQKWGFLCFPISQI